MSRSSSARTGAMSLPSPSPVTSTPDHHPFWAGSETKNLKTTTSRSFASARSSIRPLRATSIFLRPPLVTTLSGPTTARGIPTIPSLWNPTLPTSSTTPTSAASSQNFGPTDLPPKHRRDTGTPSPMRSPTTPAWKKNSAEPAPFSMISSGILNSTSLSTGPRMMPPLPPGGIKKNTTTFVLSRVFATSPASVNRPIPAVRFITPAASLSNRT